MGPILMRHKSILSLPRLGLSPVLPSSEVTSFRTPLQDTLLYCNNIVHLVGFSHVLMVCGWMMFSEVITKVHMYWLPFYLKVLLFQLITDPIKLHVHVFCPFLFDGSSHDAICCVIVCDDFSGLFFGVSSFSGLS